MDEMQQTRPGVLRRIIAFPLTLMIIEFVAVAVIAGASSWALLKVVSRNTPVETLGALALGVIVIAIYLACRRWIERVPNDELPLTAFPREMPLGLLIGAGLFTLMTGIVALLGGLSIERVNGMGALWSMLSLAITSGVFEEVLFRGILLRHVEAMLGTWAALVITSLLFGLAHLSNPDSSLFAALAIAMEAGILLGAAYLWKRRLWVPIGIHAAWNFTQGWVFSVPVSGGRAPTGLFVTSRQGAEWLTGGDFGLEASVVAMAIATLAGLLLLVRVVRQGGIRPPMWVSAPSPVPLA
ncbi:type II CAAX endopeptidase family protein [Novosphingobium sp. MMS21-SN21R]|uniref:CPBP family intramembrane glutamic endopeptidase n=1 Tax=Novosphingobium sp. MMS21-SN21R TaxID=2969298 RepID=UPI0028887CDB|nr:type II CAAX endopeptidase family protein [Novosphingobium sp. MMS21-SN21R]MDT0507687.1 type II CAAX endopeptidase family protein [Novosphingobium sp. MMS21-SN21R]